MVCKHCGTPLADDRATCPICRTVLSPDLTTREASLDARAPSSFLLPSRQTERRVLRKWPYRLGLVGCAAAVLSRALGAAASAAASLSGLLLWQEGCALGAALLLAVALCMLGVQTRSRAAARTLKAAGGCQVLYAAAIVYDRLGSALSLPKSGRTAAYVGLAVWLSLLLVAGVLVTYPRKTIHFVSIVCVCLCTLSGVAGGLCLCGAAFETGEMLLAAVTYVLLGVLLRLFGRRSAS